ncbi:uncharacterized protein [Penaeus vannamei]|uniref:uncharacterized protein n=1 Tax=Penaeus vannamei TaxID=6689 RepID=UPI00387F6529
MAVQLVSSLKGQAVEILGHLSASQRAWYGSVKAAFERRFGHQYQAEAFCARFRAKTRARGKSLQQLAQELELLVRRAYPGASEDLTAVLLRDQFIDALEDYQLQVYVKQAHTTDLQEALAHALEYESFRTGGINIVVQRYQNNLPTIKVRCIKVEKHPKEIKSGSIKSKCWKCGQHGHRRKECNKSERSPQKICHIGISRAVGDVAS